MDNWNEQDQSPYFVFVCQSEAEGDASRHDKLITAISRALQRAVEVLTSGNPSLVGFGVRRGLAAEDQEGGAMSDETGRVKFFDLEDPTYLQELRQHRDFFRAKDDAGAILYDLSYCSITLNPRRAQYDKASSKLYALGLEISLEDRRERERVKAANRQGGGENEEGEWEEEGGGKAERRRNGEKSSKRKREGVEDDEGGTEGEVRARRTSPGEYSGYKRNRKLASSVPAHHHAADLAYEPFLPKEAEKGVLMCRLCKK
jgi:hypothetical protein